MPAARRRNEVEQPYAREDPARQTLAAGRLGVMKLAAISPESQQALARSLRYWSEHWDFECPTLFGIELSELNEVRAKWPAVPSGNEFNTALALLGALRELLYGASALPKAEIPSVIGLSYESAEVLCTQVQSIVGPFLSE
jgi:hypothetical protein